MTMITFEFLVAVSLVCGNELRYVLPLSRPIRLQARCMDILTVMTDVKHVISAIDECQLDIDNLEHEWHAGLSCQTLIDATGDSTTGDKYTTRTPQPLRGNNTSIEHLRFRSSPIC